MCLRLRPFCLLLTLTIVSGLPFLIFGLIVALSPFKPSATLIQYNEIIDAWNNVGQAQFNSTTFFYAVGDSFNATTNAQPFTTSVKTYNFHYVFPQMHEFTSTQLSTSNFLGTSTFNISRVIGMNILQQKQTGVSPTTVTTTATATTTTTATAEASLLLADISRPEEPASTTLFEPISLPNMAYSELQVSVDDDDELTWIGLVTLPLFLRTKNDAITDQHDCIEASGAWDNSSSVCHILYRLKYFCVKASMNGYNNWELDKTYGGYGCRPTIRGMEHILGVWSPARYTMINATAALAGEPINMSDFDILMYSATDPLIYGYFITNDTLNFYTTDLGHYSFGQLKGFTCYFLVGLGIVLIVPSALFYVYFLGSPNRRRKYMFITTTEENLHLLSSNGTTTTSSVNIFDQRWWFESYRKFKPPDDDNSY